MRPLRGTLSMKETRLRAYICDSDEGRLIINTVRRWLGNYVPGRDGAGIKMFSHDHNKKTGKQDIPTD